MHSGKTHSKDSPALQRKMDAQKSLAPPAFELQSSPVQKKEGQSSGGAGGSGNTTGMPDQVKAKMETSMGEDFSDVKIKTNSAQAEQAGALAYAQGNEVHFASGQYNPNSMEGQKLLGHELSHVKQQREGRVKPTANVNGMAVNDDKSLENEADRMGDKAAQAKVDPAATTQLKKSGSDNSSAPVQRFKMRPGDIKRYPKFAEYIRSEMPKSASDARLTKYMEHFGTNQGDTARDIKSDLQWGQGPEIRPYKMSRSDVSFRSKEQSEIIRVNRADIEYFENSREIHQALNDRVIEANVLNGYTQFLDDQDGKDKWGKEGRQMEEAGFGLDIHSTHEARKSRRARFGDGEWEVKVTAGDAAMAQRIRVWNSSDANGFHDATVGNSFTVNSRVLNHWSLKLEHNAAGPDARKGWKTNDMITTQDSDDHFTVRSDYDGDRDRNDLVVSVRRKSKAPNNKKKDKK